MIINFGCIQQCVYLKVNKIVLYYRLKNSLYADIYSMRPSNPSVIHSAADCPVTMLIMNQYLLLCHIYHIILNTLCFNLFPTNLCTLFDDNINLMYICELCNVFNQSTCATSDRIIQ